MAQRRMFSLQIVDTDAFLDMPPTTQLLYFHLSMRADDDGFVGNPKKIMKIIGSSEDDFKVLIAKRFLLSFESGVIVIKHWRINNYIQKDRYSETKYLEEKNRLGVKENGSYTEGSEGNHVSKMDTQVRLGEVSLDKNNDSFEKFWAIYPKKTDKKKSELKWSRLPKATQEIILSDIPKRLKTDQWKAGYIPNPTTYLNGERWNDELLVEVQTPSGPAKVSMDEQQKRSELMEHERAAPDSEAKKKFLALKQKHQIGKSI